MIKFYFKDGNIIWLKTQLILMQNLLNIHLNQNLLNSKLMLIKVLLVATYTITNANNTYIPYPPFFEQERIVAKP